MVHGFPVFCYFNHRTGLKSDLMEKNHIIIVRILRKCYFLNVFVEQCQAKKSDQCQVTISHRYKRIFGSEPNSQEKDQGI